MTIEEITTLLVQLEPADHDEIQRLTRALGKIVEASSSLPLGIKKLVEAALHELTPFLAGQPEDPDKALATAVRLLCAATSPGQVGAKPEAKPAPAAAPAPPAVAAQPSVRPMRSPTLIPADCDAELVREFLTEANEHIVNAEASLLALEVDPSDKPSIDTVFRAFHTIKGVAAMLGMSAVAQLAHHAESLFSRMRDGTIQCSGAYANISLRAVDVLKETIDQITAGVGGGPASLSADYHYIMGVLKDPDAVLSAFAPTGDAKKERAAAAPEPARPAPEAPKEASAHQTQRPSEVIEAASPAALVPAPVAPPVAAPVAPPVDSAPPSVIAALSKAPVEPAKHAPDPAKAAPKAPAGEESSIRVRTDRLDRLIDMVGELVIAQSMIAQSDNIALDISGEFQKKVSHVGKIVRELQDLSMSLRMVPLKPTFQKMARVVRDVAKKGNKLVEFVTDGEDTEIDRNMVDIIAEPLVHMVRNAADHGVESPDVREQNNKPRTGTVRLAAYHSGGNVVVELRDDGAGLDRERIIAKAIEKGLILTEKGMSDSDIYNLIFEPGFSTKDVVSDVSGRGVGMDVVRRSIDSLKGRVEISSERGKGSVFMIYLPLTLAITDGMLVRIADERFIIPTVNISMSFRPEPSHLNSVSQKGELILLRDELIPLFRMDRVFGIAGSSANPTDGIVVILSDNEGKCALLVDELLGQYQVVAKTLGNAIGKVAGVSGGTILGDGRVGLIIDPPGLIALARSLPVGEAFIPPRHVDRTPQQHALS